MILRLPLSKVGTRRLLDFHDKRSFWNEEDKVIRELKYKSHSSLL